MLIRRSLAVAMAAGAVLASAALPAQAAPAQPGLKFADQLSTPGDTVFLGAYLTGDRPSGYTGASATYEMTGDVAGFALTGVKYDGEPYGNCISLSATKLVCRGTDLASSVDSQGPLLPADLTVGPSVAPGAQVKVTLTFTADGLTAPLRSTATVDVAEDVDLAAVPQKTVDGAPGSAFNEQLAVRNTGKNVIHGADVLIHTPQSIHATARFSNCFYDHDLLKACHFGQDLSAGATYQALMPYLIGKDVFTAVPQNLELDWYTAAEFQTDKPRLADNGLLGDPGKGPELKLAQVPAVSSLAKQVDHNRGNNVAINEIVVKPANLADRAMIGGTISGKVGDTTTVQLGIHNYGPATVDVAAVAYPLFRLKVTFPAGVTVTEVPANCVKSGTAYMCSSGEYTFFTAVKSVLFPFGVRIDKDVANAAGQVEYWKWERDTPFGGQYNGGGDPNVKNDSAPILVKIEGDGGTLPITGSRAGTLGGGALLLVIAGVAGVVIARRRRTRFEA